MFCRRYRCLTVATLLGICIASGAATAQPRDDQRRGQELMGLIREGLAADDPEVIIARMTAARQLEPQLRGWPLEIPRDRAKGLINGVLANGYKDRQAGDPEQNIAAAIAAYRQALGSLSAKTFPNDFAVTQKNLCNILNRKYSLPTGTRNDQEAALEACNAALTVYDPRSNPQAWADTLIDLGSIYSERSRDGVGRNLTSAVRAYRAAANVYTKEQAAQKWALIQYNIGVVYYTQSNKDSAVPMSDLLTGLRRDNLNFAFQGPVFYRGLDAYSQQKAIDAIKASLSVYTKDQFPAEFARSHNSLAVLFHEGNRRDEQIVSARAALGFYTAERDLAAHLRLTNLLAQGLMLKGDWPEAAKAYTAARKAYTALVGERPQLARAIAANFGPMHTEAAYVRRALDGVEQQCERQPQPWVRSV